MPTPSPESAAVKTLSDEELKSRELIGQLRGWLGRLRHYTEHRNSCDKESYHYGIPCSCGLGELLEEIGK